MDLDTDSKPQLFHRAPPATSSSTSALPFYFPSSDQKPLVNSFARAQGETAMMVDLCSDSSDEERKVHVSNEGKGGRRSRTREISGSPVGSSAQMQPAVGGSSKTLSAILLDDDSDDNAPTLLDEDDDDIVFTDYLAVAPERKPAVQARAALVDTNSAAPRPATVVASKVAYVFSSDSDNAPPPAPRPSGGLSSKAAGKRRALSDSDSSDLEILPSTSMKKKRARPAVTSTSESEGDGQNRPLAVAMLDIRISKLAARAPSSSGWKEEFRAVKAKARSLHVDWEKDYASKFDHGRDRTKGKGKANVKPVRTRDAPENLTALDAARKRIVERNKKAAKGRQSKGKGKARDALPDDLDELGSDNEHAAADPQNPRASIQQQYPVQPPLTGLPHQHPLLPHQHMPPVDLEEERANAADLADFFANARNKEHDSAFGFSLAARLY